MQSRRRANTASRLAAAAVAVLLGAGCGAGGGQSSDPATTTTASSGQGANFMGISVVTSSTGTRLDVMTDPLPSEQSGPCLTAIAPRAVESEGEVTVYVDLLSGPAPPFEGCALAARPVTLELAAPVGERRVTDAFGSWFRFHEGRWVGCDHVVMTCETEPAACDNGSLRAAISNADVPKRFGMSNQRCEGGFAVVDVDYGAGACPAEDHSCAGKVVRRHFWRIEEAKWRLISSDTAAGCGNVAAAAPDFPLALCRDLPPPPNNP